MAGFPPLLEKISRTIESSYQQKVLKRKKTSIYQNESN